MLRRFQRNSSKKEFKNSIQFALNGKIITLKEGEFDPLQPVSHFLRSDKINLQGTKEACGEGGCGACTIVVSSYDPISKKIKHRPVNSCLMPLGQANNTSITTIEALGSQEAGIHPIQQALIEHHGTQCGYCTPGFVMNAYAMMLENPNPTAEEIDAQFDGNLCRCTGYRSIIDGLRKFASDIKPSDMFLVSPVNAKIKPHEAPAEYKGENEPVCIHNKDFDFYIPSSLDELLELKKKYPTAQLLCGCSELLIDFKNGRPKTGVFISCNKIPELIHIGLKDDNLVFGPSTPLEDILKFCEIQTLDKTKARLLQQIHTRLRYFSSTQIRNTATVVGNIGIGGSVTDMTNFLLASDAILTIHNTKTDETYQKEMGDFFIGYRKNTLKPEEVITEFKIPLLKKDEHLFVYKQSRRRDDDICYVSSTFKVSLDGDKIKDIKLAFSGVGAYPTRAHHTEDFLKGREFTKETIKAAFPVLEAEYGLTDDTYGGNGVYRRDLCNSFLYRFYHQTQKERGLPYDASATEIIERPPAKFTISGCKHHDKKDGHVGQPVHHRAAIPQATGEAIYTDDLPLPAGGVYAAFIQSTIPRGKITSMDFSEVLKQPGVVDIVTAKDVKGINAVGNNWKDEPVFTDKNVEYIGQPIGLVLATSNEAAWKAAKLAKITYQEEVPITSIQEAIKKNSFYDVKHEIKRGDCDKAFKDCDCVLEGTCSTGGQYHFYFETHSGIAEYKEGFLKVTGSSQNPTFCQEEIARCCGIPSNHVEFITKRLGGGFGGKETRASIIANSISVAAMKVKRPVKITLDRQTDMETMSIRHPHWSKYKVGFTKDGHIKAVDVDHYFDCGWSMDISVAVTDRALLHSDSSYYVENFHTKAHLCKTNTVTATAFRGFGAPQGMITMESIINDVANHLHKKPEEIREKNLYREGQTTHYEFPLEDCHSGRTYESIKKKIDFEKQRKEIDEFNRTHKYKKRGLALTPLKFGIAFTFSTLNQGSCIVHLYKDGSVLLSHGGTEMGQGLNTKVAQIAATVLDIPVSQIHIEETSTDKCANTSPTAASSGTDLNGHACYEACMQLKGRLAPYRKPGMTFDQAIRAAWLDKVDMSARAFYSMKEVKFDWNTGRGIPFQYYVYGASASIVEVDMLTGDHQILRTDLVYDTGDTLNSAIDIGQIEGAFVQGAGWLTTEEYIKGNKEQNKWFKDGKIRTTGPSTYKIPSLNDIPQEFNVGFLEHSENSVGVYSSKAIGEPPFLLANSVAFAIVDAIKAQRKQDGKSEEFKLDFPFTPARIRTLAGTKLE